MIETKQHLSVMLEQAVQSLNIEPQGVYVDATFGRGGHSRYILQFLGGAGRLIALDRDPDATEAAKQIIDQRFYFVRAAFSGIEKVLAQLGVSQINGLLLDLGVSSPQLDEAERGFSFQKDGLLDMRMDTVQGQSASEWINSATEAELSGVIRELGEERFHKRIARAIVFARKSRPITRTVELAQIVKAAMPAHEVHKHPATRTFQAIRMHINQELDELKQILEATPRILAPRGRLVVISFHSLEDRCVKRFIASQYKTDPYPERLPVRAAQIAPPVMRPVGRARLPDEIEIKANPRARSAVMRVAERAGDLCQTG
ncbi:MAG: 16S rRNA (cytosine(1402)-N(4))-methyltransferase RsmH [Proteobacteria bacterium]|nr:16S rRNA (cytosine(1402)-N(4))-methyltransferase RsmH [Pseudomonadota bacterium]